MTAQFISDTIIRIEREGAVSYIPVDPANSDYAALLASGEPIAPAPTPVPVVPSSVTPRQVRLLLLAQGLLESVEQMIASSTEDVRITWQYASEFRRDDPLLNQLAVNLGLTSQQVDEFFIAAAAL